MRRPLSLALLCLTGCGGSCGTDTGPVPGGFAPDRRISRAVQVRLTSGGLDVFDDVISAEARRGLQLTCSQDADCPGGFLPPAGAPWPADCDRGVCREGADVGPYLPLPITPGTVSGVELCPAGASPCAGALRFGGAQLGPLPGQGLTAALDLQLTADVSLREPTLALDCVARLRPVAPATPVTADVALSVHPASGAVTLAVDGVQLNLPSAAIEVVADPRTGDAADAAGCPSLPVAGPLVGELEARLAPALTRVLGQAFGLACGACPAGASCAEGLCVEDATGAVLFDPLPYESRLQLPALLGELGYRGDSGLVDATIQAGGAADADAEGLTVGILGGAEAPRPNPRCATVRPSPVTRPGFTAPAALSDSGLADLDFDGAAETPYDVAFGVSQAFLQQLGWSVYTSGLFCGVITQREFDGLTSAALELIIPSVRFLTRSHLFPRSEAPARLSVYMRNEPQVVLGSGEVRTRGAEDEWVEPHVRLDLDDVEVNLSLLVDERFVRVMTITLDAHVGIGAVPKPGGFEPIVGVGVADLITDVRVTNSELLAETPESLEAAIPTLISLLVLELSGSQGQVDLPALPGLDLDVLGIRGTALSGAGAPDSLTVYAEAHLPGQGNLHAAADTEIVAARVEAPETAAFAVTHPGGPKVPAVVVDLAGAADGPVEFQLRVDGGPWGPFGRAARRTIRDPVLLLQGRHRIEARARRIGAYRTLDATPASAVVVVDTVAPDLDATPTPEGLALEAWDRVGPVTLSVVVDGAPVAASPGVFAWPADASARVVARAEDAAGNVTEVVVRPGAEAPAAAAPVAGGGCRAGGGAMSAPLALAGLAALALARRRRPTSRRRPGTRPSPPAR